MPLVYTKEEIKAYLANRGFDVSNEEIINKFIHDLKKMVKYEDRQRRRMKLGHDPQETNLDSTGQSGTGVGRNNGEAVLETGAGGATRQGERDDSSRSGGPSEGKQRRHQNRDRDRDRDEDRDESDPQRQYQHRYRYQHDDGRDVVDGERREREKSPSLKNRPVTAGAESQPKSRKDSSRPVTAHGNNRVGSVGLKTDGAGRALMTRKTYRKENGEAVIEESVVRIGGDKREFTTSPGYPLENELRRRPQSAREVPESRRRTNKAPRPEGRQDAFRNYNVDRTEERAQYSDLHRQSGFPNRPHTAREPRFAEAGKKREFDILDFIGKLVAECDRDDETESVTTARTINGPPDHVKRDPVALYHYYKRIWNTLKIPGENRHMPLRWNVRAHTVGNYPCVNGHPVQYLKR